MSVSITSYWRELVNGKRTETKDSLLILCLLPFSLGYGFIQRLRAAFYSAGILKSLQLPRPVISVGNITVGGTGKTPVTAWIARTLLRQGFRVAVLSRGYGGSLEGQTVVVSDGTTIMLSAKECGDEPYLLASTIAGLMVVIGTDRHAAGLLAMQQLQPDVFLLDDGFQHLRLKRDLNILLLDHARPFGNRHPLPAGLLREPLSAARRADLVIHTRLQPDTENKPIIPGKPFCSVRHELSDCISLSGESRIPLRELQGKRGMAFAGIAEPHNFFDGLRSHGLDLVAVVPLPDHADYGGDQIRLIAETFSSSTAEYAITTEKDGVKLSSLPPEVARRTLLAPLRLTFTDAATLERSLRNLLQK